VRKSAVFSGGMPKNTAPSPSSTTASSMSSAVNLSSRSVVPAGSGSPVNARTIRRRLITSLNSMAPA
jgi:hypothetical protein